MATTYKFGPHLITASQIFVKTRHCLGLVNLKPIVPGHVLVISQRNVQRFLDLTPDEVSDMFQTAQRIGKVIEKQYEGTSLTIAIQDGPEAGQSVPHCHVHVVPRKLGDYANNDDIYNDITHNSAELLRKRNGTESIQQLQQGGSSSSPEPVKGVDNDERRPRTEQEMATEATLLKALMDADGTPPRQLDLLMW